MALIASGTEFGEKGQVYENKEFTVPLNSTNYDVKATVSNAFVLVPFSGVTSIITDQDITVRFNQTTNDGITVTSSNSPYIMSVLNITNVYITNTTAASVKLMLIKV